MDKREFPRYDRELEVLYSAGNKAAVKESRGRILNISLGGVYMLTDGPLTADIPVTLIFTVTKNNDSVSVEASGNVLRSGSMNDESEMAAKHNIKSPDETSFAVIRFTKPVIELSFMLQ